MVPMEYNITHSISISSRARLNNNGREFDLVIACRQEIPKASKQ